MEEKYLTTINNSATDIKTDGDEMYSLFNGAESKLLHFPDSTFRPLRKSEFKNILRQRLWNKDLCVVVKASEEDGMNEPHISPYTAGYFPSGDIDMFSTEEMDDLDFPLLGPDEGEPDQIYEIYRKYLIGGDDLDPDDFVGPEYKNFTTVNNILSSISGQNINILPDKSYTAEVDLDPWIKRASVRSTKVDAEIEVLYSYGGKIYQHRLVAPLFYYSSEGNLFMNNLVLDIHDKVQLDWLGGVLHVFALDNKIDECIINKCKLIYGRIK